MAVSSILYKGGKKSPMSKVKKRRTDRKDMELAIYILAVVADEDDTVDLAWYSVGRERDTSWFPRKTQDAIAENQ